MSKVTQRHSRKSSKPQGQSSGKPLTVAVIGALGVILAAVAPAIVSHFEKKPVVNPNLSRAGLSGKVQTNPALPPPNAAEEQEHPAELEKNLATKRAKAGETKDAIDALNRAAQLEPKDATIHECTAHAYLGNNANLMLLSKNISLHYACRTARQLWQNALKTLSRTKH